jgi:hypothetical protein
MAPPSSLRLPVFMGYSFMEELNICQNAKVKSQMAKLVIAFILHNFDV